MSRRRLLISAAALPLVVSAAGCLRSASGSPAGTTRPLPIPPLSVGVVGPDGIRRFAFDAREGASEILPGRRTATWGYGGSILGPTLRARRGERVSVAVTNNLPVLTTVHWHGMRVPARFDGGPHQSIPPGGTWTPEWTVEQPAATLWYHPHPHGITEKQVYRGLSGFFLIDDEDTSGLNLPNEYGVDDIPLVIQDRRFTPGGGLDETDDSKFGLLGNTIITNGIVGAHLLLRTQRVRLRVLNGSTSRLYNLARSDGEPFHLVGTDNGLISKPLLINRIQLSPGERAEIVLTVRPGRPVKLRSLRIESRSGIDDPTSFGFDDTFDILSLQADPGAAPAPALPETLVDTAPLTAASTPASRFFRLEWYLINGRRMDMDRIDFVVPVDTTEVWSIRNVDNWPHNFHVHDTRFQVIAVDDKPPPPELGGWKDTVYAEPGRTYRLALHFAGPADSDPMHPYMYHCHLLHHEDQGMMGQFLVA